MRVKTAKEKEAMGKLTPVFRELNIRKDISGYEPIMDCICYQYAFPEIGFQETLSVLQQENYYIGIKQTPKVSEIVQKMQEVVHAEMISGIQNGQSLETARWMAQTRAKEVEIQLMERNKFTLLPAMKRCVVTAIEQTKNSEKILSKYSLEKLTIILEDENIKKEEEIKEHLLDYIGEEYAEYETYEERIVAYFSKQLLEYIR
jgi:hypothetical protein